MVRGKSTLLKCILGLNKPSEGKITVNQRVGYLPQMTEIQSNFPATVEEIVLSGTIAGNTKRIFYSKDDKKRAKDSMESLNLYDIRKKCFYELSGGQKQRVLIARAIASTDKVIVLDEPINGLDPKAVTQIYEFLYDLNQKEGLTVVMVSHDTERVLKYSSRVIEIENGKVIKDVEASHYSEEGNKND